MNDCFLSTDPIGFFDSGIGGLTVAKALTLRLPAEDILYFGDTAHLPYGEKSKKAIINYSLKIADFFLEQRCKCILIACHTASAVAFEAIQNHVGSRAIIFNVIDPLVAYLSRQYLNQTIGIIGTKQTITSEIYQHKIREAAASIEVVARATPILAYLIEENFKNRSIIKAVLAEYLKHDALKNMSALIMACTHYPLVQKEIQEYVGPNIQVIDSSPIVAETVAKELRNKKLLNPMSNPEPSQKFFVSDYTQSFENHSKLFFSEKVRLEHYPIWE